MDTRSVTRGKFLFSQKKNKVVNLPVGEKIPWYNRRCLRCFVDGLAFLSMWRMPAPRQPRFPFGATWMDISSAGRALPRAKVQILLRPLEPSSSDVFSYYENADGRVSAFSSCIIGLMVEPQPSKLVA